jgi:hypothetical protein
MDAVREAAAPGPLLFFVDRRDAGVPTTSLIEQMVTYLVQHRAQFSGSRAAIVVNGNASYGMARMLEIHAEIRDCGMEIEIFHEAIDAFRWLGEVV